MTRVVLTAIESTVLRCALALLVVLAQSACIHERQKITGTVVDESGAPLRDVTVMACYQGWGRSNGQLVWDKRYCSEAVLTDHAGNYAIVFTGPAHMTLHARKENWLQLQDFNVSSSQIILTSVTKRNARLRKEEQARERAFRLLRPGETASDYFCRVVISRVSSVKLDYHQESISIPQALLHVVGTDSILFVVRGSVEAVEALVEEVQVGDDRSQLARDFTVLQDVATCESNTHIVQTSAKGVTALLDERVEVLLPSIRAGWDMAVWRI